jgi:hypothetical protein
MSPKRSCAMARIVSTPIVSVISRIVGSSMGGW